MDYQDGAAASQIGAASEALPDFTVQQLNKQYENFAGTKSEEIKEQRSARHYYHGDQHTADEKKVMNKRKQPILTSNVIGRKIDGVVGLVERMRQDPKAYPRTPQQDEGAETATSAIRYVCDTNDIGALRSESARGAAINGIGGFEMFLEQGDHGDPDVGFAVVDPDCFFYDPRSFRPDFSDARYMGVAKWVDVELAKTMFRDKADELENAVNQSATPAGLQQQDREMRWVDQTDKRVFIVEHWYMVGDAWQFCFYTGQLELARGPSPFYDEKGRQFCRFIMFSANVDHDGDRYGLVRNLKSPQDEINARRSKGLHLLNTRRIIADRGAVQDVEKTRTEAARPDGYIEVMPNTNLKFDDAATQADLSGQIEFLRLAKEDVENFGPNPALVGTGVQNKSGRAISLLQQAGMAELGPFLIAYRGWTIRVYRAIWNTVQRYWTAERWIRITDNEGIAKFVQLNALSMSQFGQPTLHNNLGALDVDIILDEGPDVLNVMQDTYDTLTALAQSGAQVPPDVLIELSPLPSQVKKQVLERLQAAQQGDPQAKAIAAAKAASDIKKTEADTGKSKADALDAVADAATKFRDLLMPLPQDAPQMYGETAPMAPQPMQRPMPQPQPQFQPHPQGFGPQ